MKGMKVLVCGGRNYNDRNKVSEVLGSLAGVTHVIHGDYRGADTLAKQWAEGMGVQPVNCPANWELFDSAAGPRRNRAMLALGPDLVVAFPGGSGTADMVEAAREAGVEVLPVPR